MALVEGTEGPERAHDLAAEPVTLEWNGVGDHQERAARWRPCWPAKLHRGDDGVLRLLLCPGATSEVAALATSSTARSIYSLKLRSESPAERKGRNIVREMG